MDLSPNDIRNYEFSNQMRGYDRQEVDEFKDQVAQAMEALKQEQLKLSMEHDSIKSQLSGLKQFEETIKNAAIDARRSADLLVENAKKEAEAILASAKTEADKEIASRSHKVDECESQLTKLELAKKSYLSKLKNLISNHLELIEEVANAELKHESAEQGNGQNIEVTDSSEVARGKRETIATKPSRQSAIKTEEANAADEIVPMAAAAAPVAETSTDDLTESLRQVVRDEQGETPSAPVVSEAPAEPQTPEVSDATPPIDPELAAALEGYKAQADDAQAAPATPPTPAPDQMVETTARAEDVPNGFVAGSDNRQGGATPSSNTDKVKIDVNLQEPNQVAQKKDSSQMDPNDLASTLDSVVAKFEEEMDKAAKSE